MENMLSQDDLKAIGQMIDGKLDEKFVGFEARIDEKFVKFEARIVPEIVKQVSEKVVADVGEMIEENVLPGFERLENRLVTKDDLDRKLTEYVRKPAETIGRP